jgi:Sec7-like guanine-nucleotide exchange factor
MYKLIGNDFNEKPINGIKRLSDNAFIPFDPDNTDYQAYLEWLEEGNTPEAAE